MRKADHQQGLPEEATLTACAAQEAAGQCPLPSAELEDTVQGGDRQT